MMTPEGVRYKCQGPCGLWKPARGFKRHHRKQCREKVCRNCKAAKAREKERRTPLHVRGIRASGVSVDRHWTTEPCPNCAEAICWDTDGNGGLVALDFQAREPHRHQPGGAI